eukprot:COSAG02_NODE_17_length_55377_cov_106.402258_23_plen_415_part_00
MIQPMLSALHIAQSLASTRESLHEVMPRFRPQRMIALPTAAEERTCVAWMSSLQRLRANPAFRHPNYVALSPGTKFRMAHGYEKLMQILLVAMVYEGCSSPVRGAVPAAKCENGHDLLPATDPMAFEADVNEGWDREGLCSECCRPLPEGAHGDGAYGERFNVQTTLDFLPRGSFQGCRECKYGLCPGCSFMVGSQAKTAVQATEDILIGLNTIILQTINVAGWEEGYKVTIAMLLAQWVPICSQINFVGVAGGEPEDIVDESGAVGCARVAAMVVIEPTMRAGTQTKHQNLTRRGYWIIGWNACRPYMGRRLEHREQQHEVLSASTSNACRWQTDVGDESTQRVTLVCEAMLGSLVHQRKAGYNAPIAARKLLQAGAVVRSANLYASPAPPLRGYCELPSCWKPRICCGLGQC